ncbi:hypothetical protein CFC21_075081 [Triticum aestivum]|uniref:F-box domain-containing protein n=2 Tax=Triticum aestivum TaxID=4565 RepID=A0A3B6LYE0_WHEAT|nr:hypothetical protein CFC21_075081 [Triticum aestivum]
MPPLVSALPDELLEEIFLRLPPDEAEHLVRASLANKFWLGLLSGARFRGRYREFHGAPPMLGFLYSCHWNSHPKIEDNIPHFVPTTKFRACIPDDDWGDWEYDAWDCRHGRVLLGDAGYKPMTLTVWDPMTGCRRELDAPVLVDKSYGAAVLCVASGCDHSTCHAGPFQVVFIALNKTDAHDCVAQAWVTLPVTVPPVFVQDTLHFKLRSCVDDRLVGILKYDMSTNCLSLIDMPLVGPVIADDVILMAMEDDSLGFAHVGGLILNLWSRHMGSDGVASWTQRTVININDILPIRNPKKRLRLIGSMEGTDIIFMTTDLGIYKINLKSLQWKKVWEGEKFQVFIPYMSFYNSQERVTPSDAPH